MATLADIAAALGLNVTTVSKALNDSSDISQETKKKVRAEAERIGYARRFQKMSRIDAQNLIGIICPELTSQYYGTIVASLNSRLSSKGYDTLVMLSSFSADIERHLINRMISLNVAGLIIITESHNLEAAFAQFSGSQELPVVVMGLNYQSREHDVISVAEEHGVQSLVTHLHQQGYRSYAFIGDSLVCNRLELLKKSLNSFNIQIPKERIVLLDERNEVCGYHGMKKLLDCISFPCAVLAGYDRIALGAYRLLIEQRIRVPEDVALAGFDDAVFCGYLSTPLTSLNYDIEGLCRVATAIMIGKINKESLYSTQTVEITPKLIIRESTQQLKISEQ